MTYLPECPNSPGPDPNRIHILFIVCEIGAGNKNIKSKKQRKK